LIPVGPENAPLVSRPAGYPLIAIGLIAVTPGPYLPNPNDPATLLPVSPILE
jgi:hypothetical protein